MFYIDSIGQIDLGLSEPFRIIYLKKRLVFDKKYVFANYVIPKCSKIYPQTDFGDTFSTKPHQQTTPDSLEGSE